MAAGVAIATMATTVPAGTDATTTDFTSGLRGAAWVITAVSLLGGVVALASRPRRIAQNHSG